MMKTRLNAFVPFLLLFLFMSGILFAKTPLVILHVNDLHSQLEPFPTDNPQNPDKGGWLRMEALCRQVRSVEPNVLFFVAGDMVQGTPYFNYFKGDAETALLNVLKPTAVTLGNHEFDNGVDQLAAMLKRARFPVVCTNYVVEGTKLAGYVRQWLVVRCGPLRVGVVSANINPERLIDKKNRVGIGYLDPIETAEKTALWLKEIKKCDVVVCLSHLGYDVKGETPDDLKLGTLTRNIDVILGGHTHTFLKEPTLVKNLDGVDVVINQAGKSGLMVGRLDLMVEP